MVFLGRFKRKMRWLLLQFDCQKRFAKHRSTKNNSVAASWLLGLKVWAIVPSSLHLGLVEQTLALAAPQGTQQTPNAGCVFTENAARFADGAPAIVARVPSRHEQQGVQHGVSSGGAQTHGACDFVHRRFPFRAEGSGGKTLCGSEGLKIYVCWTGGIFEMDRVAVRREPHRYRSKPRATRVG